MRYLYFIYALSVCLLINSLPAQAQDVTIQYGDAADVNRIERAVKRIEKRGVKVALKSGLDSSGCAAVIDKNGAEIFRFSPESITSPRLGTAAYMIGIGKGTGDTVSDCPESASAINNPDIIIRYGSNITENMQSWVRVINDSGVSAVARADYKNPDCAAVIYDGNIRFEYTERQIKNGTMALVAKKLVKGERIGRRSKSDCPES